MRFLWSCLLLTACGSPPRPPRPTRACEVHATGVPLAGTGDPQLLAAGDIAECGSEGSERTARLLDRLVAENAGVVAPLGDNAYESGSEQEFRACYHPTWGRHLARTGPAVGNHEYGTSYAAGYFDYFCDLAGERFKGWYSYELGTWHVVVLNSNCGQVGGCGPGSEQNRWLRADLAAHSAKCTLAYWHHPRFSSGQHGDDSEMVHFWRALHEHGAELVLNGHEHDYERFAPQTPDGARDDAHGIREIVVGTGGRSPRAFDAPKPNSVVRQTGMLGVLALTLHDGSYDWRFVRNDEKITDTGHADCH